MSSVEQQNSILKKKNYFDFLKRVVWLVRQMATTAVLKLFEMFIFNISFGSWYSKASSCWLNRGEENLWVFSALVLQISVSNLSILAPFDVNHVLRIFESCDRYVAAGWQTGRPWGVFFMFKYSYLELFYFIWMCIYLMEVIRLLDWLILQWITIKK